MGKRGQMRWDVMSLPWIAEALAESERQYQAWLDASPHPEYLQHPLRPIMLKFADRIGGAQPFWLSRTAAALAADLAGRGIPEVTVQEVIASSDLPEVGLILWPRSLANLPWRSEEMRLGDTTPITVSWDGIAWIYDDTTISLYLLSRMQTQRAAGEISDARPKWSPALVARTDEYALDAVLLDGGASVAYLTDPLIDVLDGENIVTPMVSSLVASILLLIGQERIVTQRPISLARPPNSRQPPGDTPTVTTLDILRPREVGAGSKGGGRDDRAYRRWFVRGHWRSQPYGPRNTLRKLIYIDVHTAGHADAPEPKSPPTPQVAALYGKQIKPNRQR